MSFLKHSVGCLILFLCGITPAFADFEMEVIGGGQGKTGVMIAPFIEEAASGTTLTPIIRADLSRTAAFKVLPSDTLPSTLDPSSLPYEALAQRGVTAIAIGQIASGASEGQKIVRFRLVDIQTKQQLAGIEWRFSASQQRPTAHRLADLIYEKLTGSRGTFSTQLAYVVRYGKRYQLQVRDADGVGMRALLSSPEPIMSPKWSPKGDEIAYVSFEEGKPIVFIQSLTGGKRRAVAAFKGSNSAPAWSPDGKQLAVALTLSGESQIYLISAQGDAPPRRLTYSSGIDTEPVFTPDGQSILFTSDRTGTPHIFKMSIHGGEAQQLTLQGNYNTSPHVHPDGTRFTYVRREGGKMRVIQQALKGGTSTILSESSRLETPSFAPNGQAILSATEQGGKSILSIVSEDGQTRQQLQTTGEVMGTAWGPLSR